MTFSIFLPPQAERGAGCRSSGTCRASPARTPTSPRRRVSRRMRRARPWSSWRPTRARAA
jgi:hypothetical protein